MVWADCLLIDRLRDMLVETLHGSNASFVERLSELNTILTNVVLGVADVENIALFLAQASMV